MILRLIGAMQTRGSEWSLDEFGALFERLKREIKHENKMLRFVGYQCVVENKHEARFFGVQVDRINYIPDGMVGWELQDDSWAITYPNGARDELGELIWRWIDTSHYIVGEFASQCPAEWSSDDTKSTCEMQMTSNAYFSLDENLDDGIDLVDYDPTWPAKFDEAASYLREALDCDVAPRIEHYGSTAIPNMPAKPIIDLLVETPSLDAARRHAIPFFNRPDCEYWLYKDHLCFIQREKYQAKRTHHIHMAPADHQLWEGLIFRNYLRTHPKDAARYAALKYDLAARYRTDRERYTNAKHDFVMEILSKAQ